MVFDAQPRSGGQCSELYPHKPIYDIPGLPHVSASQLIANLEEQMAQLEYTTTSPTLLKRLGVQAA